MKEEKQEQEYYSVIKVPTEVEAKFKEKYGKTLHSLTLPMDEVNNKGLEVLAIVPSRAIVGMYLKFLHTDPNKAQEVLVKNCILTSKEQILADDALFYSAVDLLTDLIPMRKGKSRKV